MNTHVSLLFFWLSVLHIHIYWCQHIEIYDLRMSFDHRTFIPCMYFYPPCCFVCVYECCEETILLFYIEPFEITTTFAIVYDYIK